MKKTFKTLKALILRTVGAKELAKEAEGKEVLNDDQRAKITAAFGTNVLQVFEDNLNATEKVQNELDLETLLKDLSIDNSVELQEKLDSALDANKDLEAQLEMVSKLGENKPTPEAVSKFAAAVDTVPQINMSAKHNVIANQVLTSGFKGVDLKSTEGIDIAELRQEFGTVMPPKERMQIVKDAIYLGFPDAKHMTRIHSDTDYKAASASIGSIVQQFTSEWTPKGKVKINPCLIPYRRHKINVPIKPAEVLNSWIAFLYEQGKDTVSMSITEYILRQHIMPKALDDITRSMIGKGKFKDVGIVDENARGTSASEAMDGYETILVLNKQNGSTKMNFYKNATNILDKKLTDAHVLAAVDQYVDAIGLFFVGELPIFCSEQALKRYQRADFNVNGKYTGEKIGDEIRFSKFKFIVLQSMYNSPILFSTPKDNFIELVDYASADNCINDIQKVDYKLKVFGEFSLSVGFLVEQGVFAYIPDGYQPWSKVIEDVPVDTEDSPWSNGGAVRLTTPELKEANRVITWKKNPAAKSYMLNIAGTLTSQVENTFDMKTLPPGEHTVCVQAVGDGTTHSSSEYSDVLTIENPPPTALAKPVVTLAEGVITWKKIASAIGYSVIVGDVGVATLDESILSYGLNALTLLAGTHSVTVTAMGDGFSKGDSDPSVAVEYIVT